MQDGQLLLKVEDARAHYPVVIDPITQLAELTASDGVAGDGFGIVAISGSTVVAGALFAGPKIEQGAAYVFVKPPSGWANMTQTTDRHADQRRTRPDRSLLHSGGGSQRGRL